MLNHNSLSVIIPARNEIYLEKTIQNVLDNARGENLMFGGVSFPINFSSGDKFLPFWATHSFVVSSESPSSSANNASPSSSSISPKLVWFFRKFVAINAMCFSGIYRGWTITTKRIFLLRTKLQMLWVTTRPVVANYMVNNLRHSFWNRPKPICVHKPVNHFNIASKIKNTITPALNFCRRPVPAVRFRINRDFIIDSFNFRFGKFNFEIFHNKIIPQAVLL